MAKGASFEREIAKKLSLWFTNDKTDVGFYRTAGSGGRATSRFRGNKSVNIDEFGDIKADTKECEAFTDIFVLELKTGYAKKTKNKVGTKITNWSLLDELDSKQKETQFMQFWNQVTRDSELAKKEPLLIFRRPNKMPCIAMYEFIFDILQNEIEPYKDKYITLSCDTVDNMVVLNFDEFLSWTKGKIHTKKIINKLKEKIK